MSLQLLPRRFTWLFARIAHIDSTRHFKHDAATQVLLEGFIKKQERWGFTRSFLLSIKNRLVELAFSVVADAWGFFVHFGAEVAKEDERLGVAGVLKSNTGLGTGLGAEIFVLGQLMEADEFGTVERLAVDGAFALNAYAAPSALVFDGALGARIDGELLGSE